MFFSDVSDVSRSRPTLSVWFICSGCASGDLCVFTVGSVLVASGGLSDALTGLVCILSEQTIFSVLVLIPLLGVAVVVVPIDIG